MVFIGLKDFFPNIPNLDYTDACKVSPLVWSIFIGQNTDLTSGRDCIWREVTRATHSESQGALPSDRYLVHIQMLRLRVKAK